MGHQAVGVIQRDLGVTSMLAVAALVALISGCAGDGASEEAIPPLPTEDMEQSDEGCPPRLAPTNGAFVELEPDRWQLVAEHLEGCVWLQSVTVLDARSTVPLPPELRFCNACTETRWLYSMVDRFYPVVEVSQPGFLWVESCPASGCLSTVGPSPSGIFGVEFDPARGFTLRGSKWADRLLDPEVGFAPEQPFDLRIYYPRLWSEADAGQVVAERLGEVVCTLVGTPLDESCHPTAPAIPFTDGDFDVAWFELSQVVLPPPWVAQMLEK